MSNISVPIESLPKSHATLMVGLSATLLLLAWIGVTLRLITRISLLRHPGWDDQILFLSAVIFTGIFACLMGTIYVIGPGHDSVTMNELTIISNLVLATEALYVCCMIVLKLAVGMFYLRIFVDKRQRRAVYGIVGLSSIVGLLYFFFLVFQCGIPNAGYPLWEASLHGKCVSKSSVTLGLGYFHGLVNSLTDIALLLVSLPAVKAASMPAREKRVVAGVFLLASIGCIASLVRLRWIAVVEGNSKALSPAQIENMIIWSDLECGLGIFAASCAGIRPLIRRFTSWLNRITTSGSSARSGSTEDNATFGMQPTSLPPVQSKRISQDEIMNGKDVVSWSRVVHMTPTEEMDLTVLRHDSHD